MTAPDSRDSVERVVSEMREHAADLLASAEAIDASNLADKFDAVADEFRKAAAEETDRADRLQALARGPQQAGGEDYSALKTRLRDSAMLSTLPEWCRKELEQGADAIAALQAEVARLRKGIVHRGDNVVVPLHLYDEINATGAAWKQRAETAEAALREAVK